MDLHFIWLFVLLFGLMAIGVPIAFSMLVSTTIYMIIFDIPIFSAFVPSLTGVMSTTMLAAGFFMLAGNIMNNGGVTDQIFDFSDRLVSWIPGGLGHANVVASFIFAGMSGSAIGDVSGLGQVEVKAMREKGYDLDYSCGVTAASTVLGPTIPPSVPMVMYATMCGVSTGRMFMSGVIPGLIAAFALMAVVFCIAKKRRYPRTPFCGPRTLVKSFFTALPSLLCPVIILVSIYTGVISPIESAILASVYAIVVGLVLRNIRLRNLPKLFSRSAKSFFSIMFIVFAAKLFGFIISYEHIPDYLCDALGNIASPFILFLVIIVLLLIVGCVIDSSASVLMMTPVLYPVALEMGIDPVQFGLVLVFTLMIGVMTPPIGIALFILQGQTGIKFNVMCKAVVPYLVVLIACVILFAAVPALSTWLPTMIYG